MAKRDWEAEMLAAIEDYTDEEIATISETIHTVAVETKERLKATSPRRKDNGGEYAEGWEIKSEKAINVITYTVHNPKHYRLTHLLEKGHQSYNQYGGPYKRVRAKKHIKKAEVWGNTELLARLKREL